MVNQGEVDWSERENTALPEPLGITILIWLHLIKGMVFAVALIMPWFKETDVTGNVEKAGLSPTLVVLGVLLVSILCLGSGLGMMLHKTWGWYLAVYYYIHSIFRNGYTFYIVSQLADPTELGDRGPEYYYIKYGAIVVVHFLIFLYLFKSNVLHFFGLGTVSKAKVLGGLVLIYLGQLAATSMLSHL